MFLLAWLDTPITWAIFGMAVGLGLGVTNVSVWLMAAGLGAFILYLASKGQAKRESETKLFGCGPALLLGWMTGFILHGFIF